MTPYSSFQNSTICSSGVTQCSLAKTVHRYNHSPVDTTNIFCTQNRSTGKSIISSLDSDSSDYEDCWDCSSNEDNADWGISDTDSEDEYVLEIKRHAYTKKVASCFAQLFGDLPEVLHSSFTSPVESAPIEEEYNDDGELENECPRCGALFWYNERIGRSRKTKTPIFTMCCLRGKIKLPVLKEPPAYLHGLLTNDDGLSRHFRDNIRAINMMFSFTSLGGKIDNSINTGQGSVKPNPNEAAKFSQLYIHDTQNEVQNRISALSGSADKSKLRADLVESIMQMLRDSNVHVQTFRNAMDRFNDESECEDVKLVLIHNRQKDGRVYNLPTSSEVAALVPGDFQLHMDKRDIILEKYSGKLKRINELHPCYLPLQYPLIFPYGEDGFRLGIQNGFTGFNKNKKPNISMREFFAYRIQVRSVGSQVLLFSRRLLQQFLVDAYTMIESHRLRYIRKNQGNLRSLNYSKFVAAASDGFSSLPIEGNRIIIPSSFTGGPRYMHQMYLDAMTICKYYGFPDLFITFTCNPKWPELTRYFQKYNLRAEDRPDLCCRLFKVKLDTLMDDLTKKHLLGRTVSVYTIEFQKRGLPHAHILLFMDSRDKFPTAEDIDRIISAEIPDKEMEPRLHDIVKDTMIHGPCGVVNKSSPCMNDGKCTKFFPRKNVEKTTVDSQGYPIYRRREDGRFVEKKGIQLDNGYVVPYNKNLMLRYNAHINVEWCNQSRSIKYLFKYINKGSDCVTAAVTQKASKNSTGAEAYDNTVNREEGTNGAGLGVGMDNAGEGVRMDTAGEETEPLVDEIKKYFDARYISACESTWRILAFPTHYRATPVEKLTFHLEGDQPVVYKEGDTVESVMARVNVQKTMFLAWFDCCEKYPEARLLTYAEMPTRFIYDSKAKVWNRRKKGFAIGRLQHVSPSSGQLYYLRVLLNKIKGPRSYEEIKTVDGVVQASFEDACYKLGLLDDDKEYIEGLKECAFWASAYPLQNWYGKQPKTYFPKTFSTLSDEGVEIQVWC
ncbi:uncharacterized protein LOC106423477 [Brassica napus]|uniref:uncharacterized protein LOC106423477 n=1 Tax=Brassica napus TaxID=3708 RepID=UPI0020788339|nr:uncharacterized protein LOC106423477 [Brassica napus]